MTKIITDLSEIKNKPSKKEAAKILGAKIEDFQNLLQGMDGADIFTVIRLGFNGQERLLLELSQAWVKALKANMTSIGTKKSAGH